MKFGIFNFFLLGAVNKHPNCVKMKFEGDLTSIMVTRDFLGTATTTRFALTRQGNGCGELLWCGWQSWCGWQRLKAGADETYEHHDPLPQAIFKKLKPIYMCLASKDLLQRCLPCATRNAEFFYGLIWSYCVELIQWHACSLVVLQFNNCMCQGHTGCTAGGYGLLRWRVQHKCTGTKGQDVYSQEWEEDQNIPWEQGK